MKDLGTTNKILGIQIYKDRSPNKLYLSQRKYIKKVLECFGMQDCKPVSTLLTIHFRLSSTLSP
jgi:hypothetical protein